jgi:hypothetical protein
VEQRGVVVIGAGAAGMMCAAIAAARGRDVLLLDHADAPGEKIRISGGGRCNFTNRNASPAQFLSGNPHFCISALSRYTQADFLALVERHRIAWHEKTLGQLFCDGSARQIVDLLLAEMRQAGAQLRLQQQVTSVERTETGFALHFSSGTAVACDALVVASGGKSIPKMGASDFAYRIAAQFGLRLTPTRPALVPLTLAPDLLARLAPLTGVALPARVACGRTAFEEALLFTHRGLSGPAILQISSYWRDGEDIRITLLPGADFPPLLRAARVASGKQAVHNFLATLLPRRLAKEIAGMEGCLGTLADLSEAQMRTLEARIQDWRIIPSGTEGYRVAEVTLGGVDTRDLDSRTLQARHVPGLYFIGEAVDVTGWLGGYNFQWAWSSGWCAGQAV